jgi:chromosome segregation ATPase
LAVQSFLHALEKIPTLIENHEKNNRELSKDLPVLKEIAKSVWRKEDELKELKSEHAALDRKIQLSLKPIDEGEDKPNKKQTDNQKVTPIPQEKKEQTEEEKAIQQIHALFSGKLSVNDYNRICEKQMKGVKI